MEALLWRKLVPVLLHLFANLPSFFSSSVALFDLPACIDYVLSQTKQKQLAYVGHSQGTTIMFAAAAHFGSFFQRRISVFVALAPVAFSAHTSSPFFALIGKMHASQFFSLLGMKSLFRNTAFWKAATLVWTWLSVLSLWCILLRANLVDFLRAVSSSGFFPRLFLSFSL